MKKKEEKEFGAVEVVPKPCSAELAERHMRAFAEAFIEPIFRERWIHITIENPEKADRGLIKFAHHFNKLNCRLERKRTEAFPSTFAKLYGSTPGVYFNGAEVPCLLTPVEAASRGYYGGDAVFSLVPGKLAFFFHHEGMLWVCERK